MEEIQFKGVSELSKEEKEIVNKLSTEYYAKIKRKLHNDTSLQLHIKAHSKGGERKKYSAHLRVIAPTKTLESKEDDWDLARTLHKVYKNMETEVNKTFKNRA
ncbi:MAG: hypothetical protein KKE20_06855 [Nanoarchaeota archaeon]|nr:hypothetical protein [Nanoarchaeota archaeon]